jgi:hypothetical protein
MPRPHPVETTNNLLVIPAQPESILIVAQQDGSRLAPG